MSNVITIEQFFVCVGAQKAGTTWLARTLFSHPDLFMTPVKELHYFDHLAGISQHLNDRKRRSRNRKYHTKRWTQPQRWREFSGQREWYRSYMKNPIDDDWYRSLFAHRSGRVFAGEATPEYALIGRAGFQHLRSLAPNAKILYILRNPVERAWSQLLHHCRKTKIDAGGLSQDDLVGIVTARDFAPHGDYLSVLADLDAVFEASQLRVEFYEDIHADRPAALARICDFIGIDARALPQEDLERRYNRSQSAVMPQAFHEYLQREFAATADAVGKQLGHVPQAWADEFANL